MKKLGIYVRQSREKETTGSIDDQQLKGIKRANELKMPFEIYVDKGESAANDTMDNRPEMIRLIQDIERGDISDVFVIDESRLTRNQHTKLMIKSIFAEHSIKVYTDLDGTIDFTDSNQEFMSDIRTLFASKFVKDSAKKIRSVLKNRASEGKAHGGPLKPFGYTADENKNLAIEVEESKVIKEIFTMYLNGLGTGTIAKELNKKGIHTKGRKHLKNGINVKNKFNNEVRHIAPEQLTWVGNTILSILKNPIYKGERLYKNEKFPAPSIVTSEMWDAVQKQIIKNKRFTGKIKHKYLLRGLCYCARCGSNIVGRSRANKRDHYYYCSSKLKEVKCGIRSINIDYLENLVWYRIVNNENILTVIESKVEQLQNPGYIDEVSTKRKELFNRIKNLENSKDKLIDLYSSNLITKDDISKKLKAIKEQVEALNLELNIVESSLENLDRVKADFDIVKQYISNQSELEDSIDFNIRAEIIRSSVEKIIIEYDESKEVFFITIKMFYDSHPRVDLLRKGYAPKKEHYYAPAERLNQMSMPPSSKPLHR